MEETHRLDMAGAWGGLPAPTRFSPDHSPRCAPGNAARAWQSGTFALAFAARSLVCWPGLIGPTHGRSGELAALVREACRDAGLEAWQWLVLRRVAHRSPGDRAANRLAGATSRQGRPTAIPRAGHLVNGHRACVEPVSWPVALSTFVRIRQQVARVPLGVCAEFA